MLDWTGLDVCCFPDMIQLPGVQVSATDNFCMQRLPSQLSDFSNVSEGSCHDNGVILVLLVVLVDALDRLDTRVLQVNFPYLMTEKATYYTTLQHFTNVSVNVAFGGILMAHWIQSLTSDCWRTCYYVPCIVPSCGTDCQSHTMQHL